MDVDPTNILEDTPDDEGDAKALAILAAELSSDDNCDSPDISPTTQDLKASIGQKLWTSSDTGTTDGSAAFVTLVDDSFTAASPTDKPETLPLPRSSSQTSVEMGDPNHDNRPSDQQNTDRVDSGLGGDENQNPEPPATAFLPENSAKAMLHCKHAARTLFIANHEMEYYKRSVFIPIFISSLSLFLQSVYFRSETTFFS